MPIEIYKEIKERLASKPVNEPVTANSNKEEI
jgi:hypothetical protein